LTTEYVPLKPNRFTRRQAIAAFALGGPALLSSPLSTDIKVAEVRTSYEDFLYRTHIKFGGSVVDRVTLCNVRCCVEGSNGRTAIGFDYMSMGNVVVPRKLTYAQTLGAMKDLAERISKPTADHRDWGYPIDSTSRRAAVFRGRGGDFGTRRTHSFASPVASLHDAPEIAQTQLFSNAGSEFEERSRYYLGPEFEARRSTAMLPRATPDASLSSGWRCRSDHAGRTRQAVGDGLP
jgi:hypothetical protein